jgi:hypothetical protein
MHMMKQSRILISRVLFSFILVGGFVCAAQVTDNFSDGDFTSNPIWTPDNLTNWTIDNNRLRSNSQTPSSTFYLTTPSAKTTNAQWEFYINLQFNTSSTNFVDVFLTSENENLVAAGNNGYFIRIGGTPDEISLYKTTNGTNSILINGTDGVTNFSNNTFKIKVVRDLNNLWTLSYDNTGTGNSYVAEPPVTDNSFSTGSYFGIRITQSTATFFSKHFFDDFYVGEIIFDTEPPLISSVTPLSSNQLDVVFSEKVDQSSSETLSNYNVNNNVGQPSTAVLQADEKTVRLTFAQNFPNAVSCNLTVSNVKDLFDNAIISASQSFLFFQPIAAEYKDIIITEILADPSPSVGLPDAEFIEIFNRSNKPFQLQNWKITDGSSTGTLPARLMMPGDYVILCGTGSSSLFTSYGTVLGVPNFPTLNNAGDPLVLRDNSNTDVDRVTYSDTWYKDDDKKQGGYTLELIDLQNTCSEDENWVASEASNGGTPGSQNSVFANKPDLTGPKLLSAIPRSSTEIALTFNEKLDSQLPTTTSFIISPNVVISSASFTDATLKTILITLTSALQLSTQYVLVANTIYDCAGNQIQANFRTAVFGLPETATSNDVVINELLFNPRPFGVDFVEVYNRSTKYLNLKNWSIGNYIQGSVVNLRTITTQDYLVAPGAFLVFSTDPPTVQSHYSKAVSSALVKVNSLPSFPDTEGSVSVVDSEGNSIDFFEYTRDYHSTFLRDKEGVSLERISAEQSNSPDNWKSASASEGFATPGYANSNSRNNVVAGEVVVNPEAFEPIIGQPDFTQIQYNFDQGGFVANLKIVDAQGRVIKTIANNTTLGTTGFFRWDGDTDEGTKARAGYYIVWLEVFNANGKVETFRKRVVIASRR